MGKKILVVDDDEAYVGFVVVGLQACGFEILTAANGEEGLSLAKSARPDLVLLDLTMPRLHGYEVCRAMRGDKDLSDTKIIITSAKNFPVDIKTAKHSGADRYMVKPFGIQELHRAVVELLGEG